ncbi:Tfp pilus assembly protein FimT/FimU [Xylophilus sp. Leaf220]|uniref:pilus assembly FimT family protein n=1 Tax=Xylophilus sp. Leaf220 TaxID=1735686 RepID=UPI002100CA39|nr:prepilin-type N-terminal cleavage/methylation domain-containing protein [Xylophilus sp. Leaf220]
MEAGAGCRPQPFFFPKPGFPARRRRRRAGGFTLLELMVVIAIIALSTAGVAFALRDGSQTQLEREAERLAALLDGARAQSRASGVPVRWRPTAQGFVFDGLPPGALPTGWLAPGVLVAGDAVLRLGPEPLIGAQQVLLYSAARPDRALRVATDGLRPFSVAAP